MFESVLLRMQSLHAASIYYNLLLFFVVYARQKRQKESFTVLVVIAYSTSFVN